MNDKLAALLVVVTSACGPSTIPSTPESSGEATDDPATTEEAETEEAPPETEDTNETFVPKEDHATPPSCDPWAQDCPVGEKCVPYGTSGNTWDAHKCVPVTGDQAPGEPCIYDGLEAATDDCDASGMCWNAIDVDGELVGECAPFCMGSADRPECPEGRYCPIAGDGTINVCIETCDPVAQGCDAGLGCYWTSQAFACVFMLDDIPVGDPCGFVNDCAAGLMCANAESVPDCNGASCCAAYCDINLGDPQCEAAPGTSCVPFFEAGMAPPEYEHVGVCVLP